MYKIYISYMGILNSLTFLHLFLLVEQDTWQENSLDGFL